MANAAYISHIRPRPVPTNMRRHSTPHGRHFKPMDVPRNQDLVELCNAAYVCPIRPPRPPTRMHVCQQTPNPRCLCIPMEVASRPTLASHRFLGVGVANRQGVGEEVGEVAGQLSTRCRGRWMGSCLWAGLVFSLFWSDLTVGIDAGEFGSSLGGSNHLAIERPSSDGNRVVASLNDVNSPSASIRSVPKDDETHASLLATGPQFSRSRVHFA
jgi:hypothetical protein